MDVLKFEDFDIPKANVNVHEIRNYISDDQFLNLGIEIFKEIGITTSILSHGVKQDQNLHPRKWNRNEGILGGLMVRLSKIQKAMLEHTCKKEMEIVSILLRTVLETLINLKYLIGKNSPKLFDEYVEHSLREGKRLLLKVNQFIEERGHEIPLDKRVKKGIEWSFKFSGMTPNQVNEKDKQTWGESIFKKAKAVGWGDYYTMLMGIPSHSVHGNWQDLLHFHITMENGEFFPQGKFTLPRPTFLLTVCGLFADINKIYLNYLIPPCLDRDKFSKIIEDSFKRTMLVIQLYEEFLVRNELNHDKP